MEKFLNFDCSSVKIPWQEKILKIFDLLMFFIKIPRA
jgi:hypothetical protein